MLAHESSNMSGSDGSDSAENVDRMVAEAARETARPLGNDREGYPASGDDGTSTLRRTILQVGAPIPFMDLLILQRYSLPSRYMYLVVSLYVSSR